MSGDFGPRVIIPSALQFLQQNPDRPLFLVGDQSQISKLIPRKYAHKIDIVHADEVVAMDDLPSVALRSKPRSSMHLAVDLVKSGDAAACVSAGNTGALMAISKIHLRMIEGIRRPAICGPVPTLEGHCFMVDMGANVDCDAEHLLEFALMGKVLAEAIDGNTNPSIALLNNGEERSKGNQQVKRAAELFIANQDLNYIGYTEGHKLYQAAADVVVCDGFVGNIALKASEGVASYILETIKKEIRRDPVTRFLSWLAMPEIRRIKSLVDPRRFNGASFLGLNGIVVKSHGHADSLAFGHALQYAEKMLAVDVVEQIKQITAAAARARASV
ncbi:MAG: phosphate acyltransferase PlsX [Pseudomonadales bacterium]|nr:phosphate acyltransferase PlsX [Pseudomonadales bacterium]